MIGVEPKYQIDHLIMMAIFLFQGIFIIEDC